MLCNVTEIVTFMLGLNSVIVTFIPSTVVISVSIIVVVTIFVVDSKIEDG